MPPKRLRKSSPRPQRPPRLTSAASLKQAAPSPRPRYVCITQRRLAYTRGTSPLGGPMSLSLPARWLALAATTAVMLLALASVSATPRTAHALTNCDVADVSIDGEEQ